MGSQSTTPDEKVRVRMDKAILLPSVGLGTLLILVYVYRCATEDVNFNTAVMINIILQSSGIVCGFFLMGGSVSETVKGYLSGIDLYIFIGGAAVLVVSMQGILRDVFESTYDTVFRDSVVEQERQSSA